jgi:hypothetical protein
MFSATNDGVDRARMCRFQLHTLLALLSWKSPTSEEYLDFANGSLDISSLIGLLVGSSQADSRIRVSDEFNSGLLKGSSNLFDRSQSSTDCAVHAFQPAHS